MNISLPQALAAFIEQQVSRGEYSCASEFVRELIRREYDRAEIRRRLFTDSGPSRGGLADDEYFEGLRAH